MAARRPNTAPTVATNTVDELSNQVIRMTLSKKSSGGSDAMWGRSSHNTELSYNHPVFTTPSSHYNPSVPAQSPDRREKSVAPESQSLYTELLVVDSRVQDRVIAIGALVDTPCVTGPSKQLQDEVAAQEAWLYSTQRTLRAAKPKGDRASEELLREMSERIDKEMKRLQEWERNARQVSSPPDNAFNTSKHRTHQSRSD